MSDDEGIKASLPSVGLPVERQMTASPAGPPPGQTVLAAYTPFDAAPDPTAHDLRGMLFNYLQMIWKRRWLVSALALALSAIGTTRALMETPLYTSTVRIQIDREAARIVDSGGVAPAEAADGESLRTQYEILKSRSVAERVAAAIKAGDDADVQEPRQLSLLRLMKSWLGGESPAEPTALDAPTREQRAAGIIADNTSVRPVPGSRLVDISVVDPLPERAARMANAYAEAYISQTIDKRFQSSAYAKTFLEDQSKQLQIRLQEAETALLNFSEAKQIIILSERSTIVESNLAAANAALSGLIADRIRNEQIWKQVEVHEGVDLPQFLANAVIQHLRSSRKALETEYQEKLETFKPSYPAMIEISSKMREIDRQLGAEIKTIKASLRGAYDASLQQEQQTRAQIETLRAEVLDLQRNLIRYNILKREVDTNRQLYNGLLQRLKEVEVAGGVGTNNVFIVDRARVAASPTSPNLSRAIGLWLTLGIGIGLGAAYLLELLDDVLHTAEQLEQITGLATLGLIPAAPRHTTADAEIDDPRSPMLEAYRSVATSLQFSTDKGLPKTLLLASAGPGEGKSISALALSRHFAARGLRVLLVDADLRNPSLHERLRLGNDVGLSTYLAGACMPPDAMQATDIATLAFMPAGPLPPNAADLLASPRLHSLLTIGLEVFDLIVLDGPPVVDLADAQILASAATATVFIAGAGQARTGAVRAALRRLELARASVVGTVLTRYDGRLDSYGYGYGYGVYGSSQGAEIAPVRRLAPVAMDDRASR